MTAPARTALIAAMRPAGAAVAHMHLSYAPRLDRVSIKRELFGWVGSVCSQPTTALEALERAGELSGRDAALAYLEAERAVRAECIAKMAGVVARVRWNAGSRLYTRQHGLSLAHACRLGNFEAGSDLHEIRTRVEALGADEPTLFFVELWIAAEGLIGVAWPQTVSLARLLTVRETMTGKQLDRWAVAHLGALAVAHRKEEHETQGERPWRKI